jgi:succinate-semialdehyde dehydrogenase/glutarate-semialdehyde dehydrogenase
MSTTTTAERIAALITSIPTDLYIGGAWRPASTGDRFDVHDPATGAVLTTVADASAEDGLAALDAADRAQQDWAATSPRRRSDLLRAAFEAVSARAEDFALLMTLEMGKSLTEARGEAAYGAEFLRWFSEESVRVDGGYRSAPDGVNRILVTRRAVGPCLLITPWSSPWRWPPVRSGQRWPRDAPRSSSQPRSPRSRLSSSRRSCTTSACRLGSSTSPRPAAPAG